MGAACAAQSLAAFQLGPPGKERCWLLGAPSVPAAPLSRSQAAGSALAAPLQHHCALQALLPPFVKMRQAAAPQPLEMPPAVGLQLQAQLLGCAGLPLEHPVSQCPAGQHGEDLDITTSGLTQALEGH